MYSPDRREFLGLLGAGGITLGVVGGVIAYTNGDEEDPIPEGRFDVDGEIETTGTDCASPEPHTSAIERDAAQLHLTGQLEAPTPCHRAVLGGIVVDGTTLAVSIGVESTLEEDQECIQCVGSIAYEATVEVASIDDLEVVTIHHADDESFDHHV